jgi:hypothetical protein
MNVVQHPESLPGYLSRVEHHAQAIYLYRPPGLERMRAKLHFSVTPPLRQIEPVDKGYVPDLATQSLNGNSVHHVDRST